MRQRFAILLFLSLFPFKPAHPLDASFVVTDSVGCAPFTIQFFNTSTGAVSWNWDFGDGTSNVNISPLHTFYQTGNFTTVLYVYDSLMNYDSAFIVIAVPEEVPFFSLVSQACPGQPVEFFVSGNYNPSNVINWDLGDGITSNLSYFEHAFSTTGVFNVKLTVVIQSCGTVIDSNQIAITTSLLPTVHIHPEYADTIICPGQQFPFFYDEFLPVEWDFGDGVSSMDPYPIHFYDTTGNYLVKVTVTNICGNSATIDTFLYVSTQANPRANIYVKKTTLCLNEPLYFTATGAFDYNYSWKFGDGDSAQGMKVMHSFTDTGKYSITMTAGNPCGKTVTKTILINVSDNLAPAPWIYLSEKKVCPGTSLPYSCAGGFTEYRWDFGDGDTSQAINPEHTYFYAGTYPVSLTVKNYCGISGSVTDTVSADSTLLPNPDFNFSKSSYCPGEIILFEPVDTSGIILYQWNFGDGNSDSIKSPLHSYIDTGNYPVQLVVENSCGNYDSIIRAITVDSSSGPIADFYFYPDGAVCPGTLFAFYNRSTDTSNCLWYFGDGDSSLLSNPAHLYPNAGNYTVTLKVSNNCQLSSILSRYMTVTESNYLAAPIVSCQSRSDTVIFSWNPVNSALGYEVSMDGGGSWVSPTGPGFIHRLTGITDSVLFTARALGNDICKIGQASDILTCYPSGIVEQEDGNSISVFPTMATDRVFVFSKKPLRFISVRIYTATGQLVTPTVHKKSDKEFAIDLTQLPSGLLLMVINAGEEMAMKKIIAIRGED